MLSLPSGSSLYLIFSFINSLAPTPITGTEDSNDVFAVCESDRQDPAFNLAEAVVPLLTRTMGQILRNHALRIGKGELRLPERNPMPLLVLLILLRVPFEPRLRH